MLKHGDKSYVRPLLILGVVFIIMLILNAWMPLHRDDYEYSLIWNTTQHIQSMSDVLHSVYLHYWQHGGRAVTVFFLDAFLLWGKWWFDLANAALFTGLVLLMFWHARRSVQWGRASGLLAVTALLAWLSFPHFGEVAIWKSGSTVYLWSAFPAALFLLFYNLQLAGTATFRSRFFSIPMFLLGILAGWSVENLAVTVVTLTFLICVYCYWQEQLFCWMPAGLCGAFLGFIGIVAAPGNYVRYGEQGAGKGIFIHIGNIFAGTGEMILYILPMILLLLLCWRILQEKLAERQGVVFPSVPEHKQLSRWIMFACICLLVFSYFNGGFVAAAIRDFLIAHVLTPIHLNDAKTIEHFANVMAGFEEMVIYWLIIFFFYSLAKSALGFTKEKLQLLRRNAPVKAVLRAFPELRFVLVMFAAALFNNLVMIAAPNFPARATFSSVALIIIGTVACLQVPAIEERLALGKVRKILCLGGLAMGLFTVGASLVLLHSFQREDALRLVVIAKAAHSGIQVPVLPPLTEKNRALRHVFYVDFDNPVTKGGLRRYYGIKDIKVDPAAPPLTEK